MDKCKKCWEYLTSNILPTFTPQRWPLFCPRWCPQELDKDIINEPGHYKTWWLEVIDILRAKLSKKEFEWYLQWNIIKYIMRYKHKNWVEDLKKCAKYLEWLIEFNK